MTNHRTFWARTLAVAALAAGGFVAQAQAATSIYVNIAPPAPVYETVPVAPPGRIWVPGHYEWNGYSYVWMRGYWVAKRPGYDWRPAQWVQVGPRWMYQPGGWTVVARGGPGRHGHGHAYGHRRDSDRDGVPDRYDSRPHNPYRH